MNDSAPALDPVVPRRGKWIAHLAILGAYPLVLGAIAYLRRGAGTPALSGHALGAMLVSAWELASFALVFVLACLASRASRDQLRLRFRPRRWAVPLGLAYSVGIRLGVGAVLLAVGVALAVTGIVKPEQLSSYLFSNRPKVEAIVDISAMRDDPAYFWLMVTVVSFLVGGLREELWRGGVLAGFRALWPRQFGSKLGQLGAVAIAAVIFGLGHAAQGPVAMTLTGVLGLMLGAIIVLHDSVWPAVIAHGAFDATSLAILPWAMEKLHDLQKVLAG